MNTQRVDGCTYKRRKRHISSAESERGAKWRVKWLCLIVLFNKGASTGGSYGTGKDSTICVFVSYNMQIAKIGANCLSWAEREPRTGRFSIISIHIIRVLGIKGGESKKNVKTRFSSLLSGKRKKGNCHADFLSSICFSPWFSFFYFDDLEREIRRFREDSDET